MSKQKTLRRWIAVLLVITMIPVFPLQSVAANATSQRLEFDRSDYTPNTRPNSSYAQDEKDLADAPYEDNEVVRVSIILEDKSTIDAGFDTATIATDKKAVAYREKLQTKQENVAAAIKRSVLGGKSLDVVWNLTLAANVISANVEFGKLDAIKNIAGVKNVVIETQYEAADTEAADVPNMGTSGAQIGSSSAWAAGYTGAGRKIAIIDTGVDTEHISFNEGAFLYSLAKHEGSVDLMDADDIAAVLDQLNINADASKLFVSSKIPFAYNYVDGNYNVTHMTDTQGEHGSHVTGIAAANAYVPNANGNGYVSALDSVLVQGVAPDAQILTMKVFGTSGGAYSSDYFAAIEDAIVLGCDSANLSLGSTNPGWSNDTTYGYILDRLTKEGLVMVTSAGNNGAWSDNANTQGYLYNGDVNNQSGGSPGSFYNTFSVASVDNDGQTGMFVTANGQNMVYSDTSSSGYKNAPFTTIAGEHDYVYIDLPGTDEQFAEIADIIKGKIAICNRGETSFYMKANAAVANGAKAVIIVNNQPGVINMDLTGYNYTAPAVSVTLADGQYLKTGWTEFDGTEVNGYYTGKMTVNSKAGASVFGSEFYTMSSFSSWGTTGALTLKPDITAPGGNIYSVWGANASSDAPQTAHNAYEAMSGTSMASPQVAGMVAVVDQFLAENGYLTEDGPSRRALAMSLLMSTAVPMEESFGGYTNSAGYEHYYYPVLRQGSGLANVGNAVSALSYILMNADATKAYADGKVKAELGDSKIGKYSYSFTVNNLNGKELSYTLSTDLFTQDLFDEFVDTWTTPLTANIVYTVNGEKFVPHAAVSADVNRDGVTDADDAVAILNYIVGNVDGADLDLTVADVDEDGNVTSYDAYLILAGLETSAFTVPANGSVEVTVSIEITSDISDYENGAYVEGYTFVNPVGDDEGALDVTHSIPIIGFYGNWSDPSMFEQSSYVEALYGNDRVPYVATLPQWNYLSYTDNTNGGTYAVIGNPYGVEDEYPADKAAIKSTDTIYQIGFTLIRNAATMAVVITDAETGEVLYASNPTSYGQYNVGAWYYTSGSRWQNTDIALTVNQKLSSLGVQEGQQVNISFVAIPEYYLTEDILGATETEDAYTITKDEFLSIVESGELGEGAFLTTTLRVDDTAPALLDVSKNLITGALTVKAAEESNLAYIGVLTRSGTREYAGVLAPEANADGTYEYTFSGEDLATVGSKCMVLVADYAGNEAAYIVEYGGEDPDYTGKMIGYIPYYSTLETRAPELCNKWAIIDPATVNFATVSPYTYTGIEVIANGDMTVTGAVGVDNFVFFTDGSKLYVADIQELDNYDMIADFGATATLRDLAYNPVDHQLYAVDNTPTNPVYKINPLSGSIEQVGTLNNITVTSQLRSIAIDKDGTFYGTYQTNGLAIWTIDDDGTITLVKKGTVSGLTSEYGGSLFFDNSGTLYHASSYWGDSSIGNVSANNKLRTIDTETFTAALTNDAGAVLYYDPSAMFVMPANTGNEDFKATDKVADLIISRTSATLLVTGETTLDYTITPWTLKDKTVTWTSSNEAVATVSNKGVVKAVGVGEATITVTANADSTKTATCTVTVGELPSIEFSALIYDADSQTYWSNYNVNDPMGFEKITGEPASSYLAGTLVGDKLYVHNGSALFEVDADTFEVTPLGALDFPGVDGAALYTFIESGYYYASPYQNWILLVNPYDMADTNQGTGWNMTSYVGNDYFAAIANAGQTEYANAQSGIADVTYAITEGGNLWNLLFYDGNYMARLSLGKVDGIDLTGVSDTYYASMAYDDATGYLVLTSYIDGVDSGAKVQLIDIDAMSVVATTYFDEEVWPVVVNYRYERMTDLAISLDKTSITLYEGSTAEVKASVKLYTETNAVTWSTSDATVATVNNGVITAVGEGDAVITATTVDVNKNGEHVSASVNVHVNAMGELTTDAVIEAQLADGTWVSFPASDPTDVTVLGTSAALTAGGVHNGHVYGSDSDFAASSATMYELDPSNGYSTVVSMNNMSIYYAPVDLTTAPAMPVVNLDGYTGYAFGSPMYIPFDSYGAQLGGLLGHGRGMYMLTDVAEGSLFGTNNLSSITNAAAVAFDGMYYTDSIFGSHDADEYDICEVFYIMNSSNLYIAAWVPTADGTGGLTYGLGTGSVGALDMTFADDTALSMEVLDDGENYGLVVAYAGEGAAQIFYIDLLQEGTTLHVEYIGEIAGATGISSISIALPADNADAVKTPAASMNKVNVNKAEVSATSVSELANEVEALAPVTQDDLAATTYTAPKANQSAGSLNSIVVENSETSEAANSGVVIDKENKTVTVTVSAEESTNALVTVEYDSNVLTLVSAEGTTLYNAINDETDGTVKIAFADAEEYTGSVAVLVFSYDDNDEGINTTITVTTVEDGAPSDEAPAVEEVEVVVEADEPSTDEPGTDEPGTDEPGTDEPGTDEPGTDEPGTDEPGDTPKTGDSNAIYMLITILAISGAGFAVTYGCVDESKKRVRK